MSHFDGVVTTTTTTRTFDDDRGTRSTYDPFSMYCVIRLSKSFKPSLYCSFSSGSIGGTPCEHCLALGLPMVSEIFWFVCDGVFFFVLFAQSGCSHETLPLSLFDCEWFLAATTNLVGTSHTDTKHQCVMWWTRLGVFVPRKYWCKRFG